MKHPKHTKPSRQSGKPASKTASRAVRQAAGKPKGKAAARRPAGKARTQATAGKPAIKPAKKVAKKAAGKAAAKQAVKVARKQAAKQAPKPAPAAREVHSTPPAPLRPHVGPRYTDPLDYLFRLAFALECRNHRIGHGFTQNGLFRGTKMHVAAFAPLVKSR
ncbi:MAG: hypothetical protein K9N23_23445 [Akkermansiaceae bacterium]|nr:hypothetical protein [Akkermansiaceae bacterium]MCF7734658.1 hypothetical protein [Akkermansiaceae bacterium]